MKMNVDALVAMPVHEAAELFPMMDLMDGKDAGALARLAADMRDNGCHTPIVLYKGNVLDGRNRIAAAREIGIDFLPTTEYEGNDPLSYVLSLNLHRRQLTKAQLVELGIKLLPAAKDRAQERIEATQFGTDGPGNISIAAGTARDEVAKMMGNAISGKTLEKGIAVVAAAPNLWKEVQSGGRSISDAYNQIKAPPAYNPTQTVDRLLDKADRAYDSFMDVIEEMKGAGATTENFLPVINMLNNLLKQAIKTQEAL